MPNDAETRLRTQLTDCHILSLAASQALTSAVCGVSNYLKLVEADATASEGYRRTDRTRDLGLRLHIPFGDLPEHRSTGWRGEQQQRQCARGIICQPFVDCPRTWVIGCRCAEPNAEDCENGRGDQTGNNC